MNQNSSQLAIQQQDNTNHLATVIMNVVRMNSLPQKTLRQLWQFSVTSDFSEPYREALIQAIKEKII